jgi:L,D-transpeptidase ErfK/SrfK
MIAARNISFALMSTAMLFLLHFSNKNSFIPYSSPPAGVSTSSSHLIYNFENTVKIGDYFKVMEGIVHQYNSILSYPITEHHIIRNNPWVIDSLAASDYYRLKERGIISHDPKILPIFIPGQFLVIPDSVTIDSLNRVFKQTYLDLNIPEFKLRVIQADSLIYEFLVRVGRNESRYLAMSGRVTDLQTHTGEGIIVRHVKNPDFINPVNNQIYRVTRRDDGVVTGLPNIPWIETEINGVRHGQLIHPTTNIETLGKAYSNGCIGTSEAAGWYLYYYAPTGTRINIRYDLEIFDNEGNVLKLANIYNR